VIYKREFLARMKQATYLQVWDYQKCCAPW